MNSHQKHLSLCVLTVAACAALLYNPSTGLAATAPSLGTAESFAVLGGPAVSCTDSIVVGDVGTTAATIANTRCTITGTVHAGDATAVQAYHDFQTAYHELMNNRPCTTTITNVAYTDNLPALGPLAPGVYCFPAAVAFTRTKLTLDGPANGIWIFKVGTNGGGALAGTGFTVEMTGGGQPCNVFWWTHDAAALTDSFFLGTMLAGAATDVTRGAFVGRDFAMAAASLTNASILSCDELSSFSPCKVKKHKKHKKCNQGVGNGPEGCDPGNSNHGDDDNSNDENGGTPGHPGRR